MNIPEISEESRRYLKSKPSGGDTSVWVGIRTVLDLYGRGGMGYRVKSLLDRIYPELGGTFLDVGCYGGWVYPLVRDRVAYTGIDNWPDAIECAKSLFGGDFQLCDLQRYNTKHDYVWATQLHPPVNTREVFGHLRSLANKALIVTFGRDEEIIRGGEVIPLTADVTGVIYRS